ncbi:SDR family oxidoreductase [Noviherbaspirillum sedimenti]|uniref:SDR family oxidoreductase n=2 Tax=Noviherbaspirillum sedimenti TaxID=2320865 RepID=A0A3A3G5G5_9BURK|nr:SDR family oxidoreductase [Noviherbaspirillum sedimenti]
MMILVTGATGFVGSALVRRLLDEDTFRRLAVAVRSDDRRFPDRVARHVVGDMDGATDWSLALDGVSAIVHCAARVHVMMDTAADPLEEFRRVNVQGTLALARQAAAAGVRRFVFISSIKVNGEATPLGRPFTADDTPAPLDAYGISKLEAEQGLLDLSAQTGMELVIIRPPLVYGPGVNANFAAMTRWLQRGVPLPLGSIDNKRSLVAVDNLVDLIVTCITHPAAANQTFLVSDGEDISVSELLRRMAQAMGRPARLLGVPARFLELAASMLGKKNIAQRLCGSLQVDIEKTRRLLGWHPQITLDQGLKKVAEGRSREARF